MSKKISSIENSAGGIDLLIERDAGNEVRILTGKPSVSRKVWEELMDVCRGAIHALEDKEDNNG